MSLKKYEMSSLKDKLDAQEEAKLEKKEAEKVKPKVGKKRVKSK